MAGAGGDHDGRPLIAPPPPSLPSPPARKPALLLASASSTSSALLASGPTTPEPGALAAAPMAGAGADRDGRLPLVLREPGLGQGRHHGPEARPLFGNLFAIGGRRGHEGASPAPAPAETTGAAAGAAAPAEPLDQLLGAGREGSPLGQGHVIWRPVIWRPPPAPGQLAAAGGPSAPAAGGAAAAQMMHPRGGGMAMDGAAPLPRSPSPPPAPAAAAGTPVATPHGGGCARTLGWPMDVYGIEAREARAPAASTGTPVAMACGRPLGWRKDVDGIGAREAHARSQGVDCWDDVARVVQRRGVSWNKRDSKWVAYCYLQKWLAQWFHKSKRVHLGVFTSEAAAMRTYDRVVLAVKPGAETNFPSSDYTEEELARLRSLPLDDVISMAREHLLSGSPAGSASEGAPVLQQPALAPAESPTAVATTAMDTSSEPPTAPVPPSATRLQPPAAATRASKRRGVRWEKQDSTWESFLYSTYKNARVSLGYFTSEAAAMHTHDRVVLVIKPGAVTNFPSSDYSEEELARLRSLPLDDVITMAREHLLSGSPPGAAASAPPPTPPQHHATSTAESPTADTEVAADAETTADMDTSSTYMPQLMELPPAESLTAAAAAAAAVSARENTAAGLVGVQTEPGPELRSASAIAAAAASLLGRCVQRSFYPAGSTTPCWYQGRVSRVHLELGGDGCSVVPAWEVVYDDGDREVLGWEAMHAGLMPVAKRARTRE